MVILGLELPGRRVRLVNIDGEMLLQLFLKTRPITLSFSGLPEDARLVSMHVVPDHHAVVLVVESMEFSLIPAGHPIPYINVIGKRHEQASPCM